MPASDAASSATPRAWPELQRAAHVPRVEDVLDGDAVRPVSREQRRQTGVNRLQPVGKRRARRDAESEPQMTSR